MSWRPRPTVDLVAFSDDPSTASPTDSIGPTEIDVDLAGFLPDGVTLGSIHGGSAVQGAAVDQGADVGAATERTKRFDPTALDGLEADLAAVDTALQEIDAGRYEGPVWSRIVASAGSDGP